MSTKPCRFSTNARWLAIGALSWFLAGCSTPPAVQQSVDGVRVTVDRLHAAHSKDVRALATVVNEREAALKEANEAVRRAFQAQFEAQITASKLRVMEEFDRRAENLLGPEFQDLLQRQVYPAFDAIEHTQLNALVSALKDQATHADDPLASPRVMTALQDLCTTRSQRDNIVSGFYLKRAAELSNSRFRFQASLDQQYATLEADVLAAAGANPAAADKALSDFNDRVNARLAEIDTSYRAIDQTLADLSTFLDSEAVFWRFAGHFLTGASGALVDDLKNGQLTTAALADTLSRSNPTLLAKLKSLEDRMKEQAATAVNTAANSVVAPNPQPTPPATPANRP